LCVRLGFEFRLLRDPCVRKRSLWSYKTDF
jgi:hypothetical protein